MTKNLPDDATQPVPLPPPEHPRLFLRREHLPELRRRVEHPALVPVYTEMGRIAGLDDRFAIEWDALQYLLTGCERQGRAAIEAAVALGARIADLETPDSDVCFNSRYRGRAMVACAVAYDWCYNLLTDAEKTALCGHFDSAAATMECGYPEISAQYWSGHNGEFMLLRDMLSAGIAIHDEAPKMYRRVSRVICGPVVRARNWFYRGHAHHQGSDYGPYRYGAELYALWIFDRMGAGRIFDDSMRHVPYSWIYARRPDGQLLRSGDCFKEGYNRYGETWSLREGAMLAASYFGDGYMQSEWLRNPYFSYDGYTIQTMPTNPWLKQEDILFELLWRDPDLLPKPLRELPLSRYFPSPFGTTIARTGWDGRAVVAEMKIGEYHFANHHHLDAGTFQIYYRGPLTGPTGRYVGTSGGYGSSHCRDYYWRTISKNALLIHDPAEQFGPEGRDGRPEWANDGGQRLPNRRNEPRSLDDLLDESKGYRTGKVLACGHGPDPEKPEYTLLQGDVTQAYSGHKARTVRRSFAFFHRADATDGVPAVFVIFDRVVTADPSFAPYWLLHSQEEPNRTGEDWTVDCTRPGEGGRLICTPVLPPPSERTAEVIGGPGREFRAFDRNAANEVAPGEEHGCHEAGAWRIQIGSTPGQKEHLFLNVLQTTDRERPRQLPVQVIDGPERVGVRVGDRAAVFDRRSERASNPVSFRLPEGDDTCRVLVADLAAGKWRVRRDGVDLDSEPRIVSEESGSLYCSAMGGEIMLVRE